MGASAKSSLLYLPRPRSYSCRACDRSTSEWVYRCPSCGQKGQYSIRKDHSHALTERIVGLGDPNILPTERFDSGSAAFNRILGGGIPRGAVILFGGPEGSGKSTLATEMLVAANCRKSLLCTGEETATAVNERANRLELDADPNRVKMIHTTDSDEVFLSILHEAPDFVVVDSSQAYTTTERKLTGAAGSASQIKYLALGLVRIAKRHNIAILLISQVNQDGSIAGPRKQKHWVDAVIEIRRNEQTGVRFIKATKCRFYQTHIKISMVMTRRGLKLPEDVTESDAPEDLSGFAGEGAAKTHKPAAKAPAPTGKKPASAGERKLRSIPASQPTTREQSRPESLQEVAAILAEVERREKEEAREEKRAEKAALQAETVEARVIQLRPRKVTLRPGDPSPPLGAPPRITPPRKPRPEPAGPRSSSWLSGSDEDDDPPAS